MQLRHAPLLLILAFGCATARSSGEGPQSLSFSLRDLSGKTVNTADYPGRVLLVDFWATWCKPCEHSFPFYSQLQRDNEGQGLTVLAISVDREDSEVAEFLEQHPVSFQILRDPEGEVARTIDQSIVSMPTAVLIGRDGKVVLVHTGFQSGDEEKLTAAVKDALAAAEPAPPASEPRPSTP